MRQIGHKPGHENMERGKNMFYVSYITEYPIYEPAEGGYYYAGTQVQECYKFPTWKQANKCFQKMKRWFLAMHEYEVELGHVGVNEISGVRKFQGFDIGSSVHLYSRYIGEDEYIEISCREPHDKGYEPYC